MHQIFLLANTAFGFDVPGALSSIVIGCLETHNALWRHFVDDVKVDTNQIAKRLVER